MIFNRPGFLLLELMVALAIFVVMVGMLGGLLSHTIKAASNRMGSVAACRLATNCLEQMRAGMPKDSGDQETLMTSDGRRMMLSCRPAGVAVPASGKNGWSGFVVTVGWQSIDRRPMTFELAG